MTTVRNNARSRNPATTSTPAPNGDAHLRHMGHTVLRLKEGITAEIDMVRSYCTLPKPLLDRAIEMALRESLETYGHT